MCDKTATEIAMFMEECEEVTKEHFKKLETHIQNQIHDTMYRAIAPGSNVFFTGPYTCDADDSDWMPEAEREYQEMQKWIKQYPLTGWGDISPRTAAAATMELFKRGMPHMLFEKFGRNLKNNFVDSEDTSKTIKFRRYSSGKD